MNWVEMRSINGPGGTLRVFQADVADGHLTVFVGREPLGPGGSLQWHMSMSHRLNNIVSAFGKPLPGRLPTWDELKEARYKFCPDNCYMAIIMPPMAEYVNLHPTTMHLHEI